MPVSVESTIAQTIEQRAAQIMRRCDELGAISEDTDRLTRRYGTPALREAQQLVAAWMDEAGLEVRHDTVGNAIGRLPGAHEQLPALLLGSHIDTVCDAGRYDGPLGILTAIACAERLRADAAALPFAVEVVSVIEEEGVRFGTAYLGSSALVGVPLDDQLAHSSVEGVTLREAVAVQGGDPQRLEQAAYAPGSLLGYCEVHIEQGPLLEHEGLPVGVVSAIQGQSRAELRFAGVAGHAGTVPMALRHDALAAAAEFVVAVEAVARATEGVVATVGELTIEPGAPNVIPGTARLSLDLRHADDAVRRVLFRRLEAAANSIAASRAVGLSWDTLRETRSVVCEGRIRDALSAAVRETGLPARLLPSGAGHDAMVFSRIAPVGMLFVRCAGGISHNPAESVTTDDVAVALDVLDRFVRLVAKASASLPDRPTTTSLPDGPEAGTPPPDRAEQPTDDAESAEA